MKPIYGLSCCQRGGNNLSKIETGNKNLSALKYLSMPKPPLQMPGQIVNGLYQYGSGKRLKGRNRLYGGAAYVDRYGQFLHVLIIFNNNVL